jgi:8-oxo-dGTP diphosphatase
MKLYLVRHAHAGDRAAWDGADRERPLSRKGRRQADAIADRLAGAGIVRLLSSPSRRCLQTLEPLAERLALTVEGESRLAEGAWGRDALALADELRSEAARSGHDAVALCSHGDVIPELVRTLRDGGARIDDPLACPKASTWVLRADGDGWAACSYLAPPTVGPHKPARR